MRIKTIKLLLLLLLWRMFQAPQDNQNWHIAELYSYSEKLQVLEQIIGL